MAEYTFTVYELIQQKFDFGLNDYEIFDEEYRLILNETILEHYKFKEIGFQNPWLWRDRLRNRMNIIMRNKFNAMYEIKKTEFNPLYNVKMTETFSHEITNVDNSNATTEQNNNNTLNGIIINKNTNVDNSTESSSALNFSSTFPSEEMIEDNLTSSIYADNATKSKGTNTTNQTITDNGENTTLETNTGSVTATNRNDTVGNMNETYTKIAEGSSAGLPFSRAMLQFKEYLEEFQIDQQVIDALKDLFITVW